jgi:hypothetical protein
MKSSASPHDRKRSATTSARGKPAQGSSGQQRQSRSQGAGRSSGSGSKSPEPQREGRQRGGQSDDNDAS